jgi:cell division protein FtsA
LNSSINRHDIIASIDIGTTKISTIIANVPYAGEYEIIGVGKYPSIGLRKGLIVDLESTISSIRESKNIAERMAGVTIESACVGATGEHIRSIPTSAVVAVSDPHRGITAEDKRRVLEVAKKIEIPAGQRLIDVLVREYIVDGQTGIKEPLGMSGLRLEVNALLITGAVMYIENIYRAVEAADVVVEDLFLDPVASGEAVLTNDEKNSGVALIDIGGGTTDLVVYQEGCIAHTKIIPVGGDHFDSDISYGLSIPVKEAERIKRMIEGVDGRALDSQEIIEVPKMGAKENQRVPVKIIAEIIRPRLEELLLIVKKEIVSAGLMNKIPAGLVITGGGSQFRGIVEAATSIMSLPVRNGRPHNVVGLREDVQSPIFSTGVGLIKLEAKKRNLYRQAGEKAKRKVTGDSFWDRFVNSFKEIVEWFVR